MRRETATVAAVDLGASSGRVVVVRFGPSGVAFREVHRFPNLPVPVQGVLRWDSLSLYRGILDGLRAAQTAAGRIDSVAVDSWAVDYGLLDGDGQLLANPVHYRDGRTGPFVAEALATVGAAGLYAATGVAIQPFNTVFQLMAERRTALAWAAEQALLIPDLMTYWLGGEPGTELTNASTTGLLDSRTRQWSTDLAQRLSVSVEIFPPLRSPGSIVGVMSAQAASDARLDGRPLLISAPSHDTAAAVAGVPAETASFAFVSSGTWALVGLTLPEPVISEASRAAGFTNEIGASGEIRFLCNVTGFWLLQECVREWGSGAAELTEAAADVKPLRSLVDVQDPAFLPPGDMVRRITERAEGAVLTNPAEITRCVLDSVALAVRRALRRAMDLAGRRVEVVHLVGGGVENALFCRLVADATGLPVLAGPTEAAAFGNAVHQARALGWSGPALVTPPVRYEPSGEDAAWDAAEALLGS